MCTSSCTHKYKWLLCTENVGLNVVFREQIIHFITKNIQEHIFVIKSSAISNNTKLLNGAKFKESIEFCK